MRLCMRILNAPEGERLLTLDPPGGLVGRSTDSALVLGYDSVSRLHAELRHDGKDWWLHQRSQTSATLLDEQLLTAGTPRRLGPRGSLQFGRTWQELFDFEAFLGDDFVQFVHEGRHSAGSGPSRNPSFTHSYFSHAVAAQALSAVTRSQRAWMTGSKVRAVSSPGETSWCL
mgnify:CR=1 FL=1